MKSQKNLIYLVVIIVVIGLVTWAGIKYLKPSSKATADSNSQNNRGQPGNGRGQWDGQGGGRANFTPLHGTIQSVDINTGTISMKADDGSTKSIVTTSTTQITEMDNGQRQTLAITDLTQGEEINVMASDTTSTSISPQMIIIGTFTPPSRDSGPPDGGGYQGSGNQNYSPDSGDNSYDSI